MFSSCFIKAGAGADPSEVRKLNRRIKELEAQLKAAASSGSTMICNNGVRSNFNFLPGGGSGSNNASAGAGNNTSSGGSGGGGGGSEAKLLQRKLKDLETSSKKETKQLEARASKVSRCFLSIENELFVITNVTLFIASGGNSPAEASSIATGHRCRARCFEARERTALSLESGPRQFQSQGRQARNVHCNRE